MPSARVTPKIPYKYLTAPTKMVPVSVCNTRTLHNRLRGGTLAEKVWLSRVVEIASTRGTPPTPPTPAEEVTTLLSIGCGHKTPNPQLPLIFLGESTTRQVDHIQPIDRTRDRSLVVISVF